MDGRIPMKNMLLETLVDGRAYPSEKYATSSVGMFFHDPNWMESQSKFHGSKPPTRSYDQWFPIKYGEFPWLKWVTWMKYDWMMLMSDITNDKQNWLDDEWIIMKKKTSFRGCWSVLGHFWGWAVWMLLHEVEVHGAPIWWSHPIIYAPLGIIIPFLRLKPNSHS